MKSVRRHATSFRWKRLWSGSCTGRPRSRSEQRADAGFDPTPFAHVAAPATTGTHRALRAHVERRVTPEAALPARLAHGRRRAPRAAQLAHNGVCALGTVALAAADLAFEPREAVVDRQLKEELAIGDGVQHGAGRKGRQLALAGLRQLALCSALFNLQGCDGQGGQGGTGGDQRWLRDSGAPRAHAVTQGLAHSAWALAQHQGESGWQTGRAWRAPSPGRQGRCSGRRPLMSPWHRRRQCYPAAAPRRWPGGEPRRRRQTAAGCQQNSAWSLDGGARQSRQPRGPTRGGIPVGPESTQQSRPGRPAPASPPR